MDATQWADLQEALLYVFMPIFYVMAAVLLAGGLFSAVLAVLYETFRFKSQS
jgi:hypothetical protein